MLRSTYHAVGRELFSIVAAALREIGKQDMERPTKADETMLLPLAGPEDGHDFRSLCKQAGRHRAREEIG